MVLLQVLIALLYNRNQLRQKNTYQASIAKQGEENALAVLQAQENERTRIAKDLHDGVGTFLSTLKLNVQTLESALSAEKTAYNNTLDLIDKTAVELRNIMNNLSDETLQQQGLIAAVSELTLRVNQIGGTQIRFQHHGFEKRINTIIEINLYRAAQELVQNCLKHAAAKKAIVQLIEHEASIVLVVEDNGVGFNPDDKVQNQQGGMGLNNIRKRVAFIKGSMQIESAPQQGTTWVIEVPKQFV
jgi:two-component system, NarL family, sensor kinase